MNKDCIKCGDLLVVGENWAEGNVKHSKYCCIDCYSSYVNGSRMFVNGKYISTKHPLYKVGNYKTFNDAAFSSLENYEKVKYGYVYAIVNSAWPDWIKIGKAIDAEDRLNSYQTSSPMRDYKLLHHVYFNNRNKAEKKAHLIAATKTMHPWNKQDNGEWFKLTETQAIDILKETTDD